MGTERFAFRYLHIAALSLVGALLASMALFATAARATTDTFGYTGGEQTFVIPAGVTQPHVVLVGGHGGEGGFGESGNNGGGGYYGGGGPVRPSFPVLGFHRQRRSRPGRRKSKSNSRS